MKINVIYTKKDCNSSQRVYYLIDQKFIWYIKKL